MQPIENFVVACVHDNRQLIGIKDFGESQRQFGSSDAPRKRQRVRVISWHDVLCISAL
jgi:hypothetical protein